MLGLDLTERVEVEILGAKWTLKPIPWAKLETLRIALAEASDALQAASKKAADAQKGEGKTRALREFERANVPYLAACAELVRWGVDRTPSERLNAVPRVTETFAGQSFEVLAPAVGEALCRVTYDPDDGLRLVDAVAARVMEANSVEKDDLLGFR